MSMEPLQLMGVGLLGSFSPGKTSIPQMVVALILLAAFLVSLWIPVQDDGMKSLLVGAIGIVLGAYFNDQGRKTVET